MRHLKKGRRLTRTTSHKKSLMRNMATSLFEHKKIATTEAKAKELRPFAEQLITKAKRALLKEKQGLLPEGQTIDIHNRRIVYKDIKSKAVIQELFDTIAPLVAERPGGYTRIIKTGQRRGDGSHTAIIELVDWAAPQDGPANLKSRKKAKARPKKEKQGKLLKDEVVEEVEAVNASEANINITTQDNQDTQVDETAVEINEIEPVVEESGMEIIEEKVENTEIADDVTNEAIVNETAAQEVNNSEVVDNETNEETAKPDEKQ